MSAAGLIDEVQRLGVELEARGERLRYSPAAGVTPELLGRLKQHKAEVIEELRRRENPGGTTAGSVAPDHLEEAPILETRQDQEPGAVLIRSAIYGECWLALVPSMADDLRAEESQRPKPRPVLLPSDIAKLRGKSEAAVRAALEVARGFESVRVVQ